MQKKNHAALREYLLGLGIILGAFSVQKSTQRRLLGANNYTSPSKTKN